MNADAEVVEFLRGIAPFDTLDEAELLTVAAACERQSFPAGATILMQASEPSQFAWIVRRGAVELTDEGRAIDLLGVGEMFGHRSMLTGDPVSLAVTAHEQTECYRMPADVVRPVLAREDALRYLVVSVSGRYEMRAREGLTGAESSRRPVGDIAAGEVVVCTPTTTVREAAQRMVEAGSSSVLVDLGDDLGIVTDHDLRTRVIAAGAGPQTPVAEVMTAPARTVTAETASAEVLIEMLDSGLNHFPVLDARRNVIGVVTNTDLVSAAARTPFAVRAAITRAVDGQALCDAMAQLPQAVIALSEARVPAHTISAVISAAHDALTRRWIEFAHAELGPPPAPYTWFTLGSFARREAFPDSDQDNAIAWEAPVEDTEIRAWMSKLAERVVSGLDTAGIPACKGGAIATKGLFARPVSDWERIAGSWLDDPDQEKALILVSLVGDGRAVWGGDVAGARLRASFAKAKDRPRLLHLLEVFALSHKPPTGFRKDFVVEHDGDHRGTLNIKKGGLLPIVGIARSAALAAGVTGASTPARLAAAGAVGTIHQDDVAVLRDAFDLMTDLRMQHQIRQLRAGVRPDNYLDPADLNPLVRTYLKEAFQAVARVQKNLSTSMKLGTRAA